MESWRAVWRKGFAPLISANGLKALRDALRDDDMNLIQDRTTKPPLLMYSRDWPTKAACAVGFCGWKGEGLETVGEVEKYFAEMCYKADQELGQIAGCRWFLNWFDDTPRREMRSELLAEVERELANRELEQEVTS